MLVAAASVMIPCLTKSQTPQDRARQVIPLDGKWQLTPTDRNRAYEITVPGSWQAQLPELREFVGRASYAREVTIPESWLGKRVSICFGAVDYLAEVWVNGQSIGSHEGGYTPFEFEITPWVKFGETNHIKVYVVDAGKDKPVEGIKFEEIPHGKQSWYGNTSGIWQSVHLEARNQCYIKRILVDPDIDRSAAAVRAELECRARATLRLLFVSPAGADPVPVVDLELSGTDPTVHQEVRIPQPRLWSPHDPALYLLRAELFQDGNLIDSVSTRFGMRKIEAKDGMILLNNEPLFVAGALDQDFYPLTEYTPPSAEYIRDQFIKAKQLGLNLLRCHIKVPDPKYLDLADELGLLVWYEIPNWINLTEDAKRRARQTLQEMLYRDHNHPSLVMVSIINESWGVNMNEESHRRWVAEMYDYAKSLEPTRLIVDNSACGGNFHVKTDIEDFHAYFQIPDQAPAYVRWIEDFSSRPDWTFGGGAKRRGFEPLILSEFGNWGLPRLSNLVKVYGSEDPWWFGSSRNASRQATCPAGVRERFEEYHLDKVFGTLDRLADAFQEQEWLALKFQIEQLRKRQSVVGYVITEFTDLQWECNGLLDYCRNPKTFHKIMPTVQAQDIVFASPLRSNFRSGEKIEFGLWVSHFSNRDLASSKVVCSSNYPVTRSEVELPPMARGSAKQIGVFRATAPAVKKPVRAKLEISLVDRFGKVIASNYADYIVFPKQAPSLPENVVVSNGLHSALVEKIRAGASAVVCFESPADAVDIGETLKILDRSESGTWGAWCNSVIWFRTSSPAFAYAPVPLTMDFSFENLIPNCIIAGVEPRFWENDVLSGLFVGWVHSNSVIILQAKCGQGRIILTTLPLASAAKNDPMAEFMLASLARYVVSTDCVPAFEVKTNGDVAKGRGDQE